MIKKQITKESLKARFGDAYTDDEYNELIAVLDKNLKEREQALKEIE